MSEPLDEVYLRWLYEQVASVRLKNPSRTYWCLLRQLFTKEFVWIVPNDDNRVEDGKDLRYEFMELPDVEVSNDWMDIGCSVLEMLIGLSRRLAFEAEGKPAEWFWTLCENLDVIHEDAGYDYAEEVDAKLDRLIWRTYDRSGRGGLFPLHEPEKDQRDQEIWYQLNAYLLERD